jgi:hypothetical protein
MPVGQFRAGIETEVHVMRIRCDVAKSTSLAPGEFKDDYFRVDGVQQFLGLRRFRQHKFTQRKC